MSMKRHIQRDGLALLITMLLMSVLLGISTSLLNVTLKQYQLSGIARSSEIAFHAANAGIECLSYHDLALAVAGVSKFDVPGVAGNTLPEVVSISCMDNKVSADIEQIQRFITLKHVLTATPEESKELIKYLQSIQFILECDYSSLVPKLSIYKHPSGGLIIRKSNK